MSRTIHVCISVRSILDWPKAEQRRMLRSIRRGDGTPFATTDQMRNHFMDQLSMGREVLPFSDACEGFSYKTGCPGHEVVETEASA